MNQHLNKLIIDYLSLKQEKQNAVKNQNYQVAAIARDKKRETAKLIYTLLTGKEVVVKDKSYWAVFENGLNEYLLKQYGIGINQLTPELIKKLNRINILEQLDI